MYQSLFDLLVNFLGATAGTTIYTCCEVFACIACVFLLAMPFLLLWGVIKKFFL